MERAIRPAGSFLLLRNALPLRQLKLDKGSSIVYLNKQTKPKSVPASYEQYLKQAKIVWQP